MKNLDFSICDWNYTIIFNNYIDYEMYSQLISDSIYTMFHKKSDNKTIIINYVNSSNIFDNLINELEKNIPIKIQSFDKEFYSKYDKYFVSSKNRFIIHKNNNYEYEVLTKTNYLKPELLYLIREIYVRLQENQKSLFMHGTGVELNDNGLLILGNSGSGKTTFMLKMIEQYKEKFSFLSNDRIFITSDNQLNYFPIPIILSTGTAQNSQILYDFLSNQKELKYSEYTPDMLYSKDLSSKFSLYKDYVQLIFKNSLLCEKSNLNCIIIPKLKIRTGNYINIKPCSNLEDLISTCFTPYDTESLRKPWILQRQYNELELLTYAKEKLEELLNLNIVYLVEYDAAISSNYLYDAVNEKVMRKG